MTKQIWWAKLGSDKDLIKTAIVMASVTGSVGASEIVNDENGNVSKFAEVCRDGHEGQDFFLVK